MNASTANRKAEKASKTQGVQYVVWVFDQGRDVYNADQVRTYSQFLCVEAIYVDGLQVATEALA